MSMADELQKLQQLRDSGALSEAEFQHSKERLLAQQQAAEAWNQPPVRDPERETRQWALFIHLSQLAGFLVPLAGWIIPIVLWQVKKDELPGVDAHGRVVLNWMLSALIYAIACVPLVFLLIGIPLLIALGILCVLFPILGCLKANEGKVWPYPLSIRFFS